VTRSYRLGLQIVIAAISIAAGVSLFVAVRWPVVPRPAGENLPAGAFPLGDFRLVERSNRVVTQVDLRGRVWVVSFIFTRCPLSCPRISSVMKGLARRLSDSNVVLASISVDPEFDTPAVLSEYARRFGASPDRWLFLTGSKPGIHELVQSRFKLGLQEASAADKAAGSEAIMHSDRIALVDDGQVVGFFATTDPIAIENLVDRARRRALPHWVRLLPTLNATLNGTCGALLMLGWVLIRRRDAAWARSDGTQRLGGVIRAHVIVMLTAVTISVIFLASYLVYHSQARATPFPLGGPIRVVYFTILLSHTALAVAVVPLVSLTLIRAIRERYAKHIALAQLTFPIWLYVSITGVVIYLMLYHLATQSAMVSGII
jgi:protein SCO1/2/putative membrane protein